MACQVHDNHRPRPLGTVVHHVQPRAAGGPDIPSNRVEICPSGHLNVHRLLDDLWSKGRMRCGGTSEERRLAQEGFDACVAAGKPGHPVYELHEETA